MRTKRHWTITGIQDEYIDTVNTAIAKWARRADGGHSQRTIRKARKVAEKRLAGLGFEERQITPAIKDAHEMAKLIREAREEYSCAKCGSRVSSYDVVTDEGRTGTMEEGRTFYYCSEECKENH